MAKILVVDDEKAIRRSIKEILEFEKHAIDEAEDGQMALDMALKNNYDIILTNSVILHHFYLYSYHIFEDCLPAIFYSLAIVSYISGSLYNNDIYHGYLHIYGVIANILLKNCFNFNKIFF